MRKLAVFNHVSLDGYFVDANGDMSWAKIDQDDPEWTAFAAENASGDGPLLFGRVTYELMTRYWPTPMASKNDPALAKRMNKLPKVVFSRTLDKATWNNTRLVKSDMVGEIRKMKQEPGDGMVILGSGNIVSQLAPLHLIDEYQLVVNPIVLGKGRTMFDGVKDKLGLTLAKSRIFRNGKVYLYYQPIS
jgi:dihydrofolate reductase